MYKSWKRITAALLSVLMCMNGIIAPVYAEGEELPEETVMPEETPAAEEPAEAAEEAEPEAEETEPEETAEAPEEAAEEPAPQEDAEEASVPMASEDEPLDVQVFGTCTADGKEAETEFELNYYAVDYDVQAGNEPFTVDTENGAFETADSVYADGPYTAYLVAAPNEGYLYCPTAYRIEYEVSGEEYTCTVKRGTINDPENDDIFDEANYTEDADWENLTFDFVSAEKPVFSPKAEVFLDDEVPADGIFEFELRDEDGTVLETASNIGKSVDFNYDIVLDGSGYVTYFVSQSTEDDGSRLLDNAEFTWALRSDWNWDTYEYEKSIELQDEAGATVSFYDTDPTLPVFRNYSEENTVTLDEPLTVRVETDDPSLENREFKIEFNCLNYDRKVTFTTSGHEINYGFDKFTYSEVFEFEIKLVAEDDLICEDTYIYHIPVESDTDTDELLIVDPYLTKDEDEVSEAVFHVTKKGGETPDPDDELLKEIEQKKKEYDDAFAALEAAQAELAAAESALSAAEGDLNDAKANAAAKASAVTAAQDALDAKDAEIAKKTKEYNDAVTAKDTAKDEYDAAQAAYKALINAQGGADLEALNAELVEAKEDEAKAQAQIDKGSLGYFESRNADHAILILNFAIAHPTADNGSEDGKTIIGDADDATSLENMKNSFQYIREGNALRHTDEYRQKNHDECPDDLAVSHEMMALAQVNTNMAAVIGYHWHGLKVNGLEYYGENVAYGYREESPFRGWYDEEKALYKDGAEEGTGHYKNIVNPDNDPLYYQYVGTGFAINTRNGITHGQDFCMDYFLGKLEGTSIDGRTNALSVDEYEADFKEYYDDVHDKLNTAKERVKAIEKQIADIKASNKAIEDAYNLAEEKKQALEDTEAAVAAAKTAMEAEQAEREALVTSLQNAQQEKETADQTVSEKQDAYDAAKKTRDDAQAKVNAAQAVVDEKLAAYNEAKSKLISVTDIQVKSESLTMHYNETGKLTATVVPEDAYYKGVKWESLNPEIVEITETGRYHALREGDTVLTVSSNEPESTVSKTISVHVNAPAINGFKKIPNQTVESGTEPDYPETVTAVYEDGTEKEVSVIWEKLNKDQYGIRDGGDFVVKGTVEGTTLRPSFTVTVWAAEVDRYTGTTEFWLRVGGDLESILPKEGAFLFTNGETWTTTIDYFDLTEEDVSEPGDLTIDGVAFEGEEYEYPVTFTVHIYERVINKIDNPAVITVESGTEPDYPETVHAHYDDGSEEDVDVVWEELDEEEYSIRAGNTYTVKGEVEETSIEPELKIVVKPAEIDDIEEFETIRTRVKTAPVLPETAEVTWSNGDISDETITWNSIPASSYAKAGTFTAKGYFLNAKGQKETVNVTIEVYEPKIESFDAIENQTINSGNEPVYPETVTAHFDDDVTEEVSVEWQKLTKEQYGIREGGEFTVTGTVEGTDLKPEFKVTVTPATVVSTYLGVESVQTKEGVYPKLPAVAEITWSNGDETTAPVTWNEIPEEQYATEGKFTAIGTAQVSETATEAVEIEVKVYAVTITSIDDPEMITVPSGTEPAYPAKVHVYYNDNSEGDVPVTWKKLSKEEYSIREGKTYTVNGAVEGFHGEAELKIVVNPAEIESIKELEPVRTKINVAPELPAKAEVKWTNGEVSEEDIHWNEIPEKSYAKEGTFKAEGYVENAKYEEVPVSVQVTVFVPKIVSFEELSAITVPSGTEPQYPENVTAKYDDETSAEVSVEWEKLTKAQYGLRKGGEFTVTGTVKGTEEKPELTIIVEPAEPKGYETDKYFVDTALVITTGMKPSEVLPAEVRVEWTNGDVTKECVTWDKEADDVRTQPGPVYMYGTITVSDGRVFNVYTNVYVNKAGNWNVDPGDVTKEDAAQVNFNIPEGLWAARDQKTLIYNGTKQTFDFRVYNGNRLLVNKKDYTFKYSNNKNAGVHDLEAGAELNWKPAKKEKKPYITITGKGNYSGKIYVPFDILPVSEELTTVPSITVKYNKKAQKPSPAVMYNRTALKKGTDYTLTYCDLVTGEETAPKEPGRYVIHVLGIGNYAESSADIPMVIEDTSAIESKMLASGFNVKVPNVKYEDIQDKEDGLTAEELKDLVTVTYGKDKKAVTYGTDYELEVANAKSVGKATLYVKGIEDYTGTKTVTFNITGVPIKNATSLIVTSQQYTGGQIKPAELTNTSLTEGTDYELVYTNNTNAGKATVTLKGKGNYTGSIKKTFTILPVPFDSTFSVSAEDAVYVKGGAKPAVTVKHNDDVLKAGTDYTVKYSGNKKPGEGTVTVTGKGNYKGTLSEKFRISLADLADAHVTAPDKVSAAKMYSAVTLTDTDGKKLKAGTDYVKPSNSSYTYVNDTVLTNGDIRKAGYPVQPKDIAPAGTWIRVTVIGKGNYTGSAVAEYRILEKNYDLSKAKVQFVKDGKTVKSLSKEYTGREVKLEKSELVVKVGGVELEADDYVILGYTNNVNKGTATVTIAGKGEYGGTKTVKFKIGAEKMTVWETLAGLFGN